MTFWVLYLTWLIGSLQILHIAIACGPLTLLSLALFTILCITICFLYLFFFDSTLKKLCHLFFSHSLTLNHELLLTLQILFLKLLSISTYQCHLSWLFLLFKASYSIKLIFFIFELLSSPFEKSIDFLAFCSETKMH